MMGRYLPGRVWMIMGKVYLCGKEGVSRSEAFASTVMEIVLEICIVQLVVTLINWELRLSRDENIDRLRNAGTYTWRAIFRALLIGILGNLILTLFLQIFLPGRVLASIIPLLSGLET